jgi:hypothetical protein
MIWEKRMMTVQEIIDRVVTLVRDRKFGTAGLDIREDPFEVVVAVMQDGPHELVCPAVVYIQLRGEEWPFGALIMFRMFDLNRGIYTVEAPMTKTLDNIYSCMTFLEEGHLYRIEFVAVERRAVQQGSKGKILVFPGGK